jgi:hypothetical protein
MAPSPLEQHHLLQGKFSSAATNTELHGRTEMINLRMTWTTTPAGFSIRDMGSLIGSADTIDDDATGFVVTHRFTGAEKRCVTLGEAAEWLACVEDAIRAPLASV